MSSTSNNKALVFIIIVLLLTNVGVLAYFLWLKPGEKAATAASDKYKLAEPLKNEVGFTESQIAEYKKIRDSRSGRIKSKVEDLRKTRESLYRFLGVETPADSLLNIAADSIAYKQKILDLETFAHFKLLRKLCTPGQEERYDSMVQRIVHRWGSPMRSSDPKAGIPKKN